MSTATTSTTTGRSTAAVARTHQGTLLRDTPIIAHRNLLRVARQPQIAIFVVIQPIMFVLLFRYVFGTAIPIPGFDYVQYLIPGIMVADAGLRVGDHRGWHHRGPQGRHHRPLPGTADVFGCRHGRSV